MPRPPMTWDWATHTDTWDDAQREEYRRAYAAGEPVVWPHEGHDPGECDHCDTLRLLQLQADGGDMETDDAGTM